MVDTALRKPSWWTSDHWSTPPKMVAVLELEFGSFNLDPCCRPETAKAPNFFTEVDDGLKQDWFGNVFLNPPYSNVSPWLRKALVETKAGRCSLVIALLPASVDTQWFHELVNNRCEIRFVRGRVRFFGWKHTPIISPRTPSILAIYRATDHDVQATGSSNQGDPPK